jgi:RecJ-like exonuclease
MRWAFVAICVVALMGCGGRGGDVGTITVTELVERHSSQDRGKKVQVRGRVEVVRELENETVVELVDETNPARAAVFHMKRRPDLQVGMTVTIKGFLTSVGPNDGRTEADLDAIEIVAKK